MRNINIKYYYYYYNNKPKLISEIRLYSSEWIKKYISISQYKQGNSFFKPN